MMSEYFLLITDAGKALEIQAHAAGVPVNLTEFAVGDGGGSAVTPDTAQTTLVNETFRDVISSLLPDAEDSSVLQAECIIPSDSGGYTIREIGIYAEDGTLYAVGNYAEQIKPDPESGFAASLQIMAQLAVSDVADISLTVRDGSYLTETQADTLYLRQDQQLAEIEAQGAAAQQAARDHIGAVSKETTVNGHALNSNVSVTSQDIFNGQATGIVADTNLNTITTPGIYYNPMNANATAALNYPGTSAGSLLVLKDAGTTQIYTEYNGGKQYRRGLYGGEVWSSWAQVYDTAHKPTAADVGALASNGNAVSATKLQTARTISGVAFDGTANITITAANVGAITQTTADARYGVVNGVRRGGQQHKVGGDWIGSWEAPAGCLMTGLNTDEGDDGRKMGIYYRQLQYLNKQTGAWVNIGD